METENCNDKWVVKENKKNKNVTSENKHYN